MVHLLALNAVSEGCGVLGHGPGLCKGRAWQQLTDSSLHTPPNKAGMSLLYWPCSSHDCELLQVVAAVCRL